MRGALTTQVWETENTAWVELRQHLNSRMFEQHPGKFLEWVKHRSHVWRGVTLGTMFRIVGPFEEGAQANEVERLVLRIG